MISHVLFYMLLVVGVVWLYLMLHWVWLYDCIIPCQKPSAPTPAQGKGSKEPKPFLGLTTKPHCATCEQSMAFPQPPLPCHLHRCFCPSDARVTSTPRNTSVPMPPVPIGAG